ncbi:MAG: endonuclease IV [Thermoplasmata archaeon]|nr:MAG: endonuclease IV [Thermoplasmata archaeon]
MIYIGPAGAPPEVRSTEEALYYIHKEGLNALEVEFVRGVRMSEVLAKKIGKIAEDLGIKLSAHAPYYINLNSVKSDTVRKSKEHIMNTLRVAHAMGAYEIVVHAGYYGKRSHEESTEIIKREVGECAEKAEEEGLSPYIGLETMGKRSAWGTLEEIAEVCKCYRNVVPVVDFAHIHARFGGVIKSSADVERVMAEYEKIFDKFIHVHFSCIEYNIKGEKKHLPINAKDPDFVHFIEPIKKREKKYDIMLISESPLLDKDALVMKEMLGL